MTVEEQQSTSASTAPGSKEYNFAKLREHVESLQRENTELRQKLPHSELLKEAGISPEDPVVETEKIPALLAAFERKQEQKTQDIVSKALSQYKQENIFTYMQAETQGDFSKRVTEDSLKQLVEEEPEEAIALAVLKDDPVLRAQYLYQKCSRLQQRKQSMQEMSNRAEQAARHHRGESHIKAGSSGAPLSEAIASFPDYRTMARGDMTAYNFAKKLPKPKIF